MKPNFYIVFAAMAAAFVGCADESAVGGTSVEPNTLAELSSSSEFDIPNSSETVVQSSSSGDVVDVSSSSEIPVLSSSSEFPMSSSIPDEPLSSSSSYMVLCKANNGPCGGAGGGDLWDPWDFEESVKTGLYADSTWPKGVVADGSWFWELDSAEGGKSTIEWSVDLGDDGSFLPMLDMYQGIRGTITLDEGELSYEPFVRVGFRIAKDSAGNSVPVDVSNWTGICLAYSSEIEASLLLDLGDSLNQVLEHDVPKVFLGKPSSGTSRCFEWSKFRRSGWGSKLEGWEPEMVGEKAARHLVNVVIEFQGRSGKKGDFYIFGVGTNLD